MKPNNKMTNAELKLAELIWGSEPIMSMALVRLAQGAVGWSKSTTFTHLKALVEKGYAKNDSSRITMEIARDEYAAKQSCSFVDDAFGGSLPMFVASFTKNRKLTSEQVAELKQLIEDSAE